MKLATLCRACLLIAFTTSCSNGDGISGACGPFQAIYTSRDDHMTVETERQVLAHNRAGIEVGCWARPEHTSSEHP